MVFSGLSALEAGARTEIDLVYDLPESVVKWDEHSIVYELQLQLQLQLQKQPGMRERSVSIDILFPEGFKLASSSLAPTRGYDGGANFSLALTEDTLLTVELVREGGTSG